MTNRKLLKTYCCKICVFYIKQFNSIYVIRFKDKAKELSEIYQDQPLKSLDNAVYWIEYVIRHNGAHHLKTNAVELTWYEFLLLDGLFLLIIMRIIITVVLWYIGKKLWRLICSRKSKRD